MNEVRRVEDETERGIVPQTGQPMDIATTRAAQEVMAAMAVAKKFPRDENDSFARIIKSCKRKGLAEQSMYTYPRGNTTVTGPSIRLAEALAQAWGNLDFGLIELEQKNGESSVMAYCWDLETNTRQTKIFTVPHLRHTKAGAYKLTDPRDIYEMVANNGARRLRACILGVVPGDVVDAAVNECEKTIQGANKEPIGDRIRAMITAFSDLGVTLAMLERRLRHKTDAINERELLDLRKIYATLRDNMASREQFFEVDTAGDGDAPKSRTQSVVEKVKQSTPHAPEAPQTAPDVQPEPEQAATETAGVTANTPPAPEVELTPEEAAAEWAGSVEVEELRKYLNKSPMKTRILGKFKAVSIEAMNDDQVRAAALEVKTAALKAVAAKAK